MISASPGDGGPRRQVDVDRDAARRESPSMPGPEPTSRSCAHRDRALEPTMRRGGANPDSSAQRSGGGTGLSSTPPRFPATTATPYTVRRLQCERRPTARCARAQVRKNIPNQAAHAIRQHIPQARLAPGDDRVCR